MSLILEGEEGAFVREVPRAVQLANRAIATLAGVEDQLRELRPGDDAAHAAIRDTFQPFVVPFHHLVGATEQLIAANADRAEWRTVRIQFMALARWEEHTSELQS